MKKFLRAMIDWFTVAIEIGTLTPEERQNFFEIRHYLQIAMRRIDRIPDVTMQDIKACRKAQKKAANK